MLRAVVLLFVLLQTTPASARLLLNEILYDPEGADEGLEFVELWNTDSTAVPLDGITVEAGDGSRPGSWSVLHAAGTGSWAPPGAFLVPLEGALQNGPDAVRLARNGEVLDLVGYGALTAPELYRGSPAPDVPSGQSLARLRDGVDSGDNAADWAGEPEPTPGRANHPGLRLTFGGVTLEPEVPWPGEAAALAAVVRNRGTLAVEDWTVELSGFGACPGATLAPGESLTVRCPVSFATPGRFDLRIVALADTMIVPVRVGAGPLLVNEIAFHDRGAGEWVEVLATQGIADIGGYALSDAGARRYAIDRGVSPRGVAAGTLLVLAETPAALRAAYGLPDSVVLGCRSGWPALNDTDGDRVRVADLDGLLSDAVEYRAAGVERGGSLERLGAALPSGSPSSWTESVDPLGGTPGRANSMAAPPGTVSGQFLVPSTRVLRRGAPVILAFGPDARGFRVRVVVHDLLGRVRRHLVDGQRVLGEAALVWDGRDDAGSPVATGAYVARGETIPDKGEPARSQSVALTVVDR